MTTYTDIPDEWTEIEYTNGESYSAVWAHTETEIMITVEESSDLDTDTSFAIAVEQHISGSGYETDVQSHAMVASDRREAEQHAVTFMEEVCDGEHILRLLDVEKWQDTYQFYCISNSELPDGTDAQSLIDAIESDPDTNDISDLSDNYTASEDPDMTIAIDVYPRHKAVIENDD